VVPQSQSFKTLKNLQWLKNYYAIKIFKLASVAPKKLNFKKT